MLSSSANQRSQTERELSRSGSQETPSARNRLQVTQGYDEGLEGGKGRDLVDRAIEGFQLEGMIVTARLVAWTSNTAVGTPVVPDIIGDVEGERSERYSVVVLRWCPSRRRPRSFALSCASPKSSSRPDGQSGLPRLEHLKTDRLACVGLEPVELEAARTFRPWLIPDTSKTERNGPRSGTRGCAGAGARRFGFAAASRRTGQGDAWPSQLSKTASFEGVRGEIPFYLFDRRRRRASRGSCGGSPSGPEPRHLESRTTTSPPS